MTPALSTPQHILPRGCALAPCVVDVLEQIRPDSGRERRATGKQSARLVNPRLKSTDRCILQMFVITTFGDLDDPRTTED